MDTGRKHSPVTVVKTTPGGQFGRPLGIDFRSAPVFPPLPDKLQCGELELDRRQERAMLAGHALQLTRREYTVLAFLVERQSRAVKREDLLAHIWTLELDYGSNVLDVYVARLRHKFGPHAAMIQTVRGFGYRLRPPLAA